MATDENEGKSLGALERFVVENDELLQLEERIGRFNIFDALGIVRVEIRHSNFLAWLLDPNESHGQGSLFFNGVLMDVLRQSPPALRPFSPIRLDGAEIRGVRVRREYRKIDILVECDEPRFVVAIENKIGSREHSDQLGRYKKTVKELYGDVPAQFVYLTREGDEPSDGDWTTYTYRNIHDTLQRICKANSSSIGSDVLTFLEHYLNLLRSRFMDDPDIDELCQTIYKNHRQAIDLIIERIGPGSEAIVAIAEEVSKLSGWRVAYQGPQYVQVVPVEWEKMLPPIAKRTVVLPDQWLLITFRVGARGCFNVVNVSPTTDAVLRRKVIERLVADPKEFCLTSLFKNVDRIGNNSATLGRINIERWDPEVGPDIDKLLPKVRAVLDRRAKELKGVPAAVRPIVAEWEREVTTRLKSTNS